MSRLLLTIAVEDAALGPLGAKEAAAMALEGLGGVRVLKVDVREPEQLGMEGVVPERRPSSQQMPSSQSREDEPSAPTSAGPRRSGRSRPPDMLCCLSCASYQSKPGVTAAGEFHWGVCRRSGELVHDLKDQCKAWTMKEVRS